VFSNGKGNEAAVPFGSTIGEAPVLPFDNTNGLGMGVALANSGFTAVTIKARPKNRRAAMMTGRSSGGHCRARSAIRIQPVHL
jgi:hypothetical protein